MAAPSLTPVLVGQHVSLIDYDSNSKQYRNMTQFTLDEQTNDFVDLIDFDNLESDSDHDQNSHSQKEEYISQNVDTFHSIILTPTSSMRYGEFEKNNQNYIQLSLLKYPGDYHHSIRYYAKPRSKCILYIPSLKMFFYGDGQNSNNIEKNTLINVKQIIISQTEKQCHKQGVTNKFINKKYKQQWIKIIGQQRIALFVSKNNDDIQNLAKYIQQSLYQPLNENNYIQGVLNKFVGKNMNEIKLNKIHQKHVIYVPSAKILIYGDNDKDRQKCDVLHINDVYRGYLDNFYKSLNKKYPNRWLKISATSFVLLYLKYLYTL